MTTRVLIIGPSYTAALRTAAPRVLEDYPDLSLDFFAAPGAVYRQLEFDPVGKRVGVLSDDVVTDEETALLLRINGCSSISYEAYHAMLSELGHKMLPDEGWWHSGTPRIFVSPAPRIAETCTSSTSRTMASWIPLVEKNLTTPAAFAIFPAMLMGIYDAHRIGFILNPEKAYGATGLTKKEFADSAIYMHRAEVRKESDSIHMNADFGTVCLRNIVQIILAGTNQTA
jgi:hypothetical protein